MAKSKRSRTDNTDKPDLGRYIAWALMAGVWLLLVASLVSYDPADPPGLSVGLVNHPTHNWVGYVGAMIAHHTYLMIGPGVWVAVAGLSAFLAVTGFGRKVDQLLLRAVGLVMMTLATSALVAVCLPQNVGWAAQPHGAGGLVALYLNDQLLPRFATPGSLVILVVGFWIGAILAADRLIMLVPKLLGEAALRVGDIRLPRLPRPQLAGVFTGWRGRESTAASKPSRPSRNRKRSEAEAIDELAGGLGATESFDPDELIEPQDDEEDQEEQEVEEQETDDEEEKQDDDEEFMDKAEGKKQFDPEQLRAKIRKLPINFAPPTAKKVDPPREVDLSGYAFPGIDLLFEPESNFTAEMERVVREQAMQLESALQQYRIDGEVVGIDSGPVITLFEVRLAPGTKVAQLNAVSSDLARALKAQNIRVVANMAGKDTVGIEVPNTRKERVALKELMTTERDGVAKMVLPMFLGKDASGNPLIQDLTTMPHMLIAGTTGSGKSVCMNSIIMSFLYTKRPDEVKLVLVDPKMVEMSVFKDIPHLMCPVVTEMSRASAILEWAVTKMDERYELLAEASVRDVAGYNSLGEDELRQRMGPSNDEEWARTPKHLPYMVFVIDELADLMITNKEVEASIVRIAQKARAVGIHLILATQRPQANVVTGLIKSNMPCRITFKVASGMDSRIVLDQKGGELLLGQGDMLFLSPRSSKLIRAQGTFVHDTEVRKTVKFLKSIAVQNFEPSLVQLKTPGSAEEYEGESDPLFDEAVQIVLEKQKGSVSFLQRALRIGYSRSSRLFEQMEAFGIVGPQNRKGQERDVLIGIDEWRAMKAQAEADAAVTALASDGVKPGETAEEGYEDVESFDEQDIDDSDEYEDEDEDEDEDEGEEK
ncbi:MAG: DNA translocase FtsK 4TM domain-containing protein [Phycisphaeraceae bacterium]|nr:DNA translocase FtsK 4TM domain-containing protein [Phycisphaeraceae bacterium]